MQEHIQETIEEDEIDIKEIFHTLDKHKYKILVITLLFTLFASVYAYLQPNIYKAITTVEIEENKKSANPQDILSMAMNSASTNMDTEIEIITSRALVTRALEGIDVTHKYFATYHYRERELYKASPFTVDLNKGQNISFYVYPSTQKSYRLVAKGEDDISHEKWSIDKLYHFGELAQNDHFSFTLSLENNATLQNDMKYRFIVLEEQDAIANVRKNIAAAPSSKTSTILEISYTDNVSVRAYEFVNSLAQAYLQQGIERKTEEASMILDFIDKQLAGIDHKLQSSETKLENFKKKSNMVNLGSKAKDIVSKVSQYESKLAEANINAQMLDSLYRKIKKSKNFENISGAGLDLQNTDIPQLIKALQEAQLKRNILLGDYTYAHPEVKRLTKSIAQSKKVISSTIKTLKTRVNKRKALLRSKIKEYNALMKALPEKEKILGGLQRKFVVNEKIYSYLLEKRATTAIAKASTVNKSRILDTALLPKKPIKPKRKLIIIIGFLLGLILGIFLAFILEFLNDRIIEEEDIYKHSSLSLLGTIPSIKAKNKDDIIVLQSPKSIVSEAFRALRTNLQFMHSTDKTIVISITSTVGNEGKTTVASNLAAIISLTQKKTIVLNLDMRKPTLHTLFNLPNNNGMSTLLANKTNLKETIQQTSYENLDIISSGPIPPNPSELIGSDTMTTILTQLKKLYDVIIIDTPPVGLVADALTLMKESDVSLYILRSEYSKKAYLADIQKMLTSHDIKKTYLILNGIKANKKGSGYGYGGGYGYYEES